MVFCGLHLPLALHSVCEPGRGGQQTKWKANGRLPFNRLRLAAGWPAVYGTNSSFCWHGPLLDTSMQREESRPFGCPWPVAPDSTRTARRPQSYPWALIFRRSRTSSAKCDSILLSEKEPHEKNNNDNNTWFRIFFPVTAAQVDPPKLQSLTILNSK